MMSFRPGLQNQASIRTIARSLASSTTTMAPTATLQLVSFNSHPTLFFTYIPFQDNMNPCIKKMQYAVRGPLVIRATEIEKVYT